MAQWHQNYHFVKDVINIIIMSRPSSTVIINKNSHVFFFIQRQRKYLSHFFYPETIQRTASVTPVPAQQLAGSVTR